ncbi:hypothetical protein KA529_02310 [Candidatus Saccharibacteria bacterium]|nr:hypothetical protein [Candidatus Saccharibacteria bacterium]
MITTKHRTDEHTGPPLTSDDATQPLAGAHATATTTDGTAAGSESTTG